MEMYITAFPDLRFSVDQLLCSGDYVVTRYTATGTHRGDLMGIAPTNRRAETHGCTIAEIKNGKIVHGWIYWDTGHLLRQLGVMPAS
jgi:predicted ester cyclase